MEGLDFFRCPFIGWEQKCNAETKCSEASHGDFNHSDVINIQSQHDLGIYFEPDQLGGLTHLTKSTKKEC